MPLLILIGGLFGASGVALSAASAHGGADLAPAALLLLVHAPALLALGLCTTPGFMRIGGVGLALGAALFAGDIATRHFLGHRLFPMAAPTGACLMIAGWLAVGLTAFLRRA